MLSPGAGTVGLLVAMAASILASGAAAADCKSLPKPRTDWSDCNKRQIMLGRSNLAGSTLFNTDFTSTDLSGSDLTSANLEKATLMRASLAGAKADKANFSRVEAYRGNFTGISAEHASFASSELQRADFTGARLTGADFEKAELGRANFEKAVLTGTRFATANLSRAILSGSQFEGPIDFSRAFMFQTRIEGVDLSQASGLMQDQIDLTCGDAATKLPAGISAPSQWPCPADDD
ncbi:pentapeptide repeat-containing protein [Sinorhizobium alkalisoli]|uniref:Pentapeptide repeat family protein n=1 Tax=Sinorhizobium alkalisoli TaxID=1752398 RepID=A0A1E3VFR5_9HYPH|nr:pentapeptide repeat-containing protein [Sinorhizobium alkalisoli]MCA1491825.1 pentapeptide repeat-containing protein [Ensifer sp. NBAIM29]MCG5480305.1 pentapeptide repeat-containing protein [Sinorhizobium alkalisoli]ODR92429.1 hypothetical protein A8M32_05190 [Sinorhizobium alkalisoli]